MTAQLNAGKPYFGIAGAFRDSADALFHRLEQEQASRVESTMPVSFLYSHAAELFLKAFLRLRGLSEQACRDHGHDLAALSTACHERGLDVTGSEPLLRLLADGHADYQFRYFERSFTTADLRWIRAVVGRLADAVSAEIDKERQSAEQAAREANQAPVEVAGKIVVSVGPSG
jgi:hypothetical protein